MKPKLFTGTYAIFYNITLLSVLSSSVTQSCPTLCDLMNHRMAGPSVHHQLPESTQIHVHRVSDVIQPSHPLSSTPLQAVNPSQHQGFSNESALCIRWSKYSSFNFNISPSNEHPGLISFRTGWISVQSKGLSRVFSNTTVPTPHQSKRLLISWLQSPSAVILEPRKRKSATVSTVSPSICHEVMGPDAMILVF